MCKYISWTFISQNFTRVSLSFSNSLFQSPLSFSLIPCLSLIHSVILTPSHSHSLPIFIYLSISPYISLSLSLCLSPSFSLPMPFSLLPLPLILSLCLSLSLFLYTYFTYCWFFLCMFWPVNLEAWDRNHISLFILGLDSYVHCNAYRWIKVFSVWIIGGHSSHLSTSYFYIKAPYGESTSTMRPPVYHKPMPHYN